jgi:hypothetical protein
MDEVRRDTSEPRRIGDVYHCDDGLLDLTCRPCARAATTLELATCLHHHDSLKICFHSVVVDRTYHLTSDALHVPLNTVCRIHTPSLFILVIHIYVPCGNSRCDRFLKSTNETTPRSRMTLRGSEQTRSEVAQMFLMPTAVACAPLHS